MKNKLNIWESSVIENMKDIRFIDRSGEFLPGGSYYPVIPVIGIEIA